MPLYVYALTDGAVALDDLRGVQGEALDNFSLAFGCVVAGRADERPSPSRDALAAQDRIVRAVHERTAALLPVRFGTLVQDEEVLREHPRLQREALENALAGVRGREQMTMRLATDRPLPSDDEIVDARTRSGRAYLEARARGVVVPPPIRQLLDAVAILVRAERREPGRVPGLAATVYHLIDRGCAGHYRAAIEARVSTLPELSVTLAGPAPAYAFGWAAGV